MESGEAGRPGQVALQQFRERSAPGTPGLGSGERRTVQPVLPQGKPYTLDEIVEATARLKKGEVKEDEAEAMLQRLASSYPDEAWEKLSEEVQKKYSKEHYRLSFRLGYRNRPDILAVVEENWQKSDANSKPRPTSLPPHLVTGTHVNVGDPLSMHEPLGEQLRFASFLEKKTLEGAVLFDELGIPQEKHMHHIVKAFYRPEETSQEETRRAEGEERLLTEQETIYLAHLKRSIMLSEHTNTRLPAENSMHRTVRKLHRTLRESTISQSRNQIS